MIFFLVVGNVWFKFGWYFSKQFNFYFPLFQIMIKFSMKWLENYLTPNQQKKNWTKSNHVQKNLFATQEWEYTHMSFIITVAVQAKKQRIFFLHKIKKIMTSSMRKSTSIYCNSFISSFCINLSPRRRHYVVPRLNYICVNSVQTTGQNLIQN